MFLFYFSLSPFLFWRNSENKISPLSLPSWQLYRKNSRWVSLKRDRGWLTIEDGQGGSHLKQMDAGREIRRKIREKFFRPFALRRRELPSLRAPWFEVCPLARVLSRYVFLPKDDVPGPTDCRKGPLSGSRGWSGVKTVRMEKSVKRPCEKRGVLGVRNRIFTGVAPGRWRARAKSERVERNQREVEHTTREYTGRNDRRNFT